MGNLFGQLPAEEERFILFFLAALDGAQPSCPVALVSSYLRSERDNLQTGGFEEAAVELTQCRIALGRRWIKENMRSGHLSDQ